MNQFALRTVGVNLQTTIAMDLQEPLNQKPVRRIERRVDLRINPDDDDVGRGGFLVVLLSNTR